jgi:hypothetical protein
MSSATPISLETLRENVINNVEFDLSLDKL